MSSAEASRDVPERARDWRAPLLGALAWAAAGAALIAPGGVLIAAFAVAVSGAVTALWRKRMAAAVGLVVIGGALASAAAHRAAAHPELAERWIADAARLEVRARVLDGSRAEQGRFGPEIRFRAMALAVRANGVRFEARIPIRVRLDAAGPAPERGAEVLARGVLRESGDPSVAGLLTGREAPDILKEPRLVDRAGNRAREAVRSASAKLGPGPDALVPALIDGDEQAGAGTASFEAAFNAAGMTHLLAVSGTNLTLLLATLLMLARVARAPPGATMPIGLAGVACFVVLAGPEPSVLRAAVMGAIALWGIGRAGPHQGLRALGGAVLALILADPWLAQSIGFALSVVATAGILLLVPRWRAAWSGWMPVPVAEAVAVPLAAQLACTPLVAAFSGQISLVAVGANIAAAPLVGPATVIGLGAGLISLVSTPAGQLAAMPAGWCAAGIIGIARQAASLPVASIAAPGSAGGLVALAVACVVVGAGVGRAAARPVGALVCALGLVAAVLVPVPSPGWPPPGWLLAACDVGQGDALVLAAGPEQGIVIDTGPDPGIVDRCLRDLGVRAIPLLVLTHFHADHVGGLPGVLRRRKVGAVLVSPLREPAAGAVATAALLRDAGVAARVPRPGERGTAGRASWQVLGPLRPHPESESPPNDASVVLLAEVDGIRLLLLGDAEPAEQADLRRAWPGLRAEVLKVAHHGSARQDYGLTAAIGAKLAVISAGRDNPYGHPAAAALHLLAERGMAVARTDRDGDLAVAKGSGDELLVTRRGPR